MQTAMACYLGALLVLEDLTRAISLAEVNDGVDLLRRADGVRTVIVPT